MDRHSVSLVIRRRWLLRAAGGLGALLVLAAYAPAAAPAPAAKAVAPVKLGAVFPYTGGLSEIGQSMKFAAELAVETINAQGGIKSLGGAKIELLYGDSQGKPDIGVSETERLIQQGKVIGLIGAWQSSVTLPTTQVAERLKVPYINPLSGANSVTQRGFKYTFSLATTHFDHGKIQIDYLANFAEVTGKKIQRIAFIHEDTEYGQNTTNSGVEHAQKKGWKNVVRVAYSTAAPDLSTEVSRVKAANPDVIFQASYLNDGILIARAMDKLGVNQQIVDGGGAQDPKFVKTLGPLAEGWAMLDLWNKDVKVEGARELSTRYKAKAGYEMAGDAAKVYQSVMVYKIALEMAGRAEPEAIRDALTKVDIRKGPDLILAQERIKFDQNGKDMFGRDVISEIRGGELVTVFPADVGSRKPAPRKR